MTCSLMSPSGVARVAEQSLWRLDISPGSQWSLKEPLFLGASLVLRNYLGAVSHVDAFYLEQHVFGDVGGVVGNSLQVPRDRQQTNCLRYALRLTHETDQLLERRAPQGVHGIVR